MNRGIGTPSNGAGLNILVFSLFFLSGAFALIYEVSWVRAMSLQFGSTTLAVSTVLTLFMGGLALGAWLAGKMADRFTDPLARYGLIEIALAVYALLTPVLFRLVFPIFDQLGANAGSSLWGISIIRFLIAALLLLPPTILMGATLPVLSRFHVLRHGEGARGAGLLYGINTVGAVAGTLAVGFLLLPSIGLNRTIVFAGLGNLALGLTALIVGRRAARDRKLPDSVPLRAEAGKTTEETGTGIEHPADSDRTIVLAVAFTGFAALVCQVAWTRVLALVLGGSIYAFAVVLATFLAGLGAGAVVAAMVLKAAPSKARVVFYWLALSAAAALGLTFALFQYLPEWFRSLYWSWNLGTRSGAVLWVQFLLSGAVMLLPSLLMGGLFPAALRVFVRDPRQAGRRVGNLYAGNTVGTIIGAFAAGFVLIPLLGIRGSLLLAAAAQCLGGVLMVLPPGKGRWAFNPAGIGVAVALLVLLLTPPWHRQLMTSAMYRYANAYSDPGGTGLKNMLASQEQLLFYRDGLTSTVTVIRDLTSQHQSLYITGNGKIDGSSWSDMPTQRLSAHIPLLFHPAPQDVCVIGMGTGSSVGSAALHPEVGRVDVVEIESAMVEGARFFSDHNHDIHSNEKVNIHVSDGRLFLRLRPASYDVISSEPSNPWQAGSSDLFTVEFFELGARALREGGIFCQWVQIYGMSPENLKTIVRTFASVFPNSLLLSTIPDTDLLMVGFNGPLMLDISLAVERMEHPPIGEDLSDERVGINTFHDLAARFRMGPSDIRSYVGQGPLHTDDLPLIAYLAPRDLYTDTREENMRELARFSQGIGPGLRNIPGTPEQRRLFFETLAAAYRRFLPGGMEAEICDQLAREIP